MYAVRPISKSQVCLKEIVNSYEISVSFDDSCGAMADLGRGDIRVYNTITNEDITYKISGDMDTVITATIDNLTLVSIWCRNN